MLPAALQSAMKRPSRPLVLAVLAAISPLALDGCTSTVGVAQTALEPSGAERPGLGTIEVLIFQTDEDRHANRLAGTPVLSEIHRVESGGDTLVGRSMSAGWFLSDLPEGEYRVSVARQITPEGDVAPLREPVRKSFDVVPSRKTTLRIVLTKPPNDWAVLGVFLAATALSFALSAATDGRVPPIPPEILVGAVVLVAAAARPGGPVPTAADVFPAPGSVVAARKVTVNFLVGVPLAADGFDPDAILALGTLSGELPGAVAWQAEDQLLRFTPTREFTPGETVTVTLDLEKVRAAGGRSGEGKVSTWFRVAK